MRAEVPLATYPRSPQRFGKARWRGTDVVGVAETVPLLEQVDEGIAHLIGVQG